MCKRVLTFLLLGLFPLFAKPASNVELVVLSPHTWDTYAPQGKEVDAIYGDFVLRNDQIVAVIANPVEGRHANMKLREVGGLLVDLTRRDNQSDQLGVYRPLSRQFRLRFAGVNTRAPSVYQMSDLQNLFVQAEEIMLGLIAEPLAGHPDVTLRYRLSKSSPYLQVETFYSNPGQRAVEFELLDIVRADRSEDLLTPEVAPNGKIPLFWVYDKWFGQAYGWICEGRDIDVETEPRKLGATNLRYLPRGQTRLHLQPGESFELIRRVFPGSTMFDVRAVANAIAGIGQKHVVLEVRDGEGQKVEGADIVVSVGQEHYAWGKTGSDGKLEFHLPPGKYQAEISAPGRDSRSLDIDPSSSTAYDVVLSEPGYVTARITDESGGPIPVKVQFRGKNEMPDPFFGPDSGEHAVHNLYYTHNGRFRQALAPGLYQVIISRGPEYDAVFTEIDVKPGSETPLQAKLVRTVRTPGWVSSDFHAHSSPSGDNISSQLGRVLNFLGEHIEFAPCTEHNRIDSYIPHLKRLGVEHLMATCSGIELTSTPGEIAHQNAFPLIPRPHVQDNGAPPTSLDPEIQIERLALWDNRSEKVVQQNHPDIGQLFFDRNGDGQQDEGYSKMFRFIDVIEVHPPVVIFGPPLFRHPQEGLLNNRMINWLQLLNQGFRIPGVVNTDAHSNFHGLGFLRNYLKSPTDDPAQIKIIDMVRAAERGQLIMTNGPFLEVNLAAGGPDVEGTAGEELTVPTGKARLQVRVQCPNWFDIDRVQVFLDGRPAESLNFTLATHPQLFRKGTVRFDHNMNLELRQDTHIIVAAVGEKSRLGPVMGPHENDLPIAVSNPIFVDVNGGGFQHNGDTLGVPLPVKQGR